MAGLVLSIPVCLAAAPTTLLCDWCATATGTFLYSAGLFLPPISLHQLLIILRVKHCFPGKTHCYAWPGHVYSSTWLVWWGLFSLDCSALEVRSCGIICRVLILFLTSEKSVVPIALGMIRMHRYSVVVPRKAKEQEHRVDFYLEEGVCLTVSHCLPTSPLPVGEILWKSWYIAS